MVINAFKMRCNDLIEEERSTDIVDEVLLSSIDAPTKKVPGAGMREDNRKTASPLCLFGIFPWYELGLLPAPAVSGGLPDHHRVSLRR